jgi:hypothetical protein
MKTKQVKDLKPGDKWEGMTIVSVDAVPPQEPEVMFVAEYFSKGQRVTLTRQWRASAEVEIEN